jgi:hypothetical protein
LEAEGDHMRGAGHLDKMKSFAFDEIDMDGVGSLCIEVLGKLSGSIAENCCESDHINGCVSLREGEAIGVCEEDTTAIDGPSKPIHEGIEALPESKRGSDEY